MPFDKIVINASPLILLYNSDLSFLLPELFEEVMVPEAVWREIVDTSNNDKAARLAPQSQWLNIVTVTAIADILRWDLGAGETEVLSFASTDRDYIPVLDDGAAKKCATAFGIPTLGTGSILILAKEKELIDSVTNAMNKLRNAGMWVSDSVVELIKRKAGEG
jgi:predicted nucleic acid-binding protein